MLWLLCVCSLFDCFSEQLWMFCAETNAFEWCSQRRECTPGGQLNDADNKEQEKKIGNKILLEHTWSSYLCEFVWIECGEHQEAIVQQLYYDWNWYCRVHEHTLINVWTNTNLISAWNKIATEISFLVMSFWIVSRIGYAKRMVIIAAWCALKLAIDTILFSDTKRYFLTISNDIFLH